MSKENAFPFFVKKPYKIREFDELLIDFIFSPENLCAFRIYIYLCTVAR